MRKTSKHCRHIFGFAFFENFYSVHTYFKRVERQCENVGRNATLDPIKSVNIYHRYGRMFSQPKSTHTFHWYSTRISVLFVYLVDQPSGAPEIKEKRGGGGFRGMFSVSKVHDATVISIDFNQGNSNLKCRMIVPPGAGCRNGGWFRVRYPSGHVIKKSSF